MKDQYYNIIIQHIFNVDWGFGYETLENAIYLLFKRDIATNY